MLGFYDRHHLIKLYKTLFLFLCQLVTQIEQTPVVKTWSVLEIFRQIWGQFNSILDWGSSSASPRYTMILMHIHKCTNGFGTQESFPRALKPPEMTEPRNTKESPTRYDQSRSPFLWIILFFYLYTNTFQQIYTWTKKKSAGLRTKKLLVTYKILRIPERNMATYEVHHCQWLQWFTNIHIMSNKLRSMYNVKTKAACRQDNRAFLQNYLLWCLCSPTLERQRGPCVCSVSCFMFSVFYMDGEAIHLLNLQHSVLLPSFSVHSLHTEALQSFRGTKKTDFSVTNQSSALWASSKEWI